jgi:hypothetical protein
MWRIPSQLALDETQTYNSRSPQKSLAGVGNSAETQCGVIAFRELPSPCGSLNAGRAMELVATFPRKFRKELVMKKMLVSFLLTAAMMVAAQDQPAASQQPAAPVGQAAPAQSAPTQAAPAQPAAGGQAAAPEQKKVIKDPAEYNAYVSAVQATDPNAKISGLESFLQQYPNSVMKQDALELLMATYEQSGNAAKMTDTANRLLQVDSSNLRALALLTYTARQAAESGQNAQQNLAQAAQYGQRGMQAEDSAAKPEGMSDADFQKLKAQTKGIFCGAVGLNDLQNKDYKNAQDHLQCAVTANPANLRDVYPLALAYLTATPPDDAKGLFYIARAANLAAGSPAAAQITDFGKKRYAKYHGSEDGWTDLLNTAKTATEIPANFTIAAAPPPPTPAQQAADLVSKKQPKEMSFAEWQLILSSGNQDASDKVWTAIKGSPLRMKAQIISASPTKLEIAATVDDIDAKRADIILNMSAPIPRAMMPKVGEETAFEGNPVSFEPQPFVMTLDKGVLLTAKAPATHRRRTGTGR